MKARPRGTWDHQLLFSSVAPSVVAALLGNAFIGRDAMKWFKELRRPAIQLPMPGFVAVGGIYYLVIGTVLHRSAARRDQRAYRLALVVLAGNELWNVAFFGRRSTKAGFWGIVAFTVPLTLLQVSVRRDRLSMLTLSPYTAWVIGYDVPWAYLLWRRNP